MRPCWAMADKVLSDTLWAKAVMLTFPLSQSTPPHPAPLPLSPSLSQGTPCSVPGVLELLRESCSVMTPSASSVPKFVVQKPDYVKIQSKFTADRESFRE